MLHRALHAASPIARTARDRRAAPARPIAALFLPVTAVGLLLGMNSRSGFEASGAWLCWALTALATGLVVRASVTPGEKSSAR